jgi:predicted RNase H-like HicB family nuclease/DNA-binding XRE family transcriptional regulator
MQYLAKLTREGRHWLVSFPDCPGCQTFASAKDEALALAADALDGWLETELDAGEVPPRPRAHRGGVPIDVRAGLDVAIQIRWLRDGLALTQAELAKRVGVSQQQIAKLERASSNPTIRTLVELTDKIGGRVVIEVAPPAASRKGLLAKRPRLTGRGRSRLA